mgnify:CR=1 FL=1
MDSQERTPPCGWRRGLNGHRRHGPCQREHTQTQVGSQPDTSPCLEGSLVHGAKHRISSFI